MQVALEAKNKTWQKDRKKIGTSVLQPQWTEFCELAWMYK